MCDEFPRGLESFVDHVVPLLQERGIHKRDYAHSTLRERVRNQGRIYEGAAL